MVSTSETLERTLASLSFYTGKIEIDNFLLIIVGILFLLFLYDGLFHALFERWKRAHWK